MKVTPKLTLVGAGPGDPDLISVKGLRALERADAVLYDALVDERLLRNCRKGCELVYVGKRPGRHSWSQEDINRLIVAYAFNYGHVVRLKGGDPFVFGRGMEEKQYAEIFDIPVSVIPGISSAMAVPASQHIPVTLRGVSESYWVVTATKKTGALSDDIQLAARSTATVVILMGIRKLPEIADIFCRAGKSDLPVAVIQHGTTEKERYVTGTIKDIAARVTDAGIGSPGIIIAGEVVAVHPSFEQLSLITEEKTTALTYGTTHE